MEIAWDFEAIPDQTGGVVQTVHFFLADRDMTNLNGKKTFNSCETTSHAYAKKLIINLSHNMRFPTILYMRPAKPQISLRIRAVWSQPLLVACIFYECSATELQSLKGDCTSSSEPTLVKMPHCWKSHVAAQLLWFWSSKWLHQQSDNWKLNDY